MDNVAPRHSLRCLTVAATNLATAWPSGGGVHGAPGERCVVRCLIVRVWRVDIYEGVFGVRLSAASYDALSMAVGGE